MNKRYKPKLSVTVSKDTIDKMKKHISKDKVYSNVSHFVELAIIEKMFNDKLEEDM